MQKVFCIVFLSLMPKINFAMISTHFKCRGGTYPRSTVDRFPVPDDKVNWTTEYAEYKPANFTSPSLNGKPWADPEIGKNVSIYNKLN